MRALCIHGHFYQPPREHPWLGVVEPQQSAAPARDWNARITAECYAPNAAARVLDAEGRLRDVVNNYAWTSFNFGPTLLGWLEPAAAALVEALRRADDASRERTGHGNAWAQAYGHAILPLSTPRDVRTQVLWGRRDFEHRFRRPPDGMWLPEMAVDRTTLAALADAGIGLTLLAPHQAGRIRPLGAGEGAWRTVDAGTLDTRRVYRWIGDGGRSVDVVFRDAALSHDLAFGGLLADGVALAARLRAALTDAGEDALVTVAVDGETFGHHQRFGEMGLAYVFRTLAADADVVLMGPAAFRARHPARDEVEIVADSSWSCVHGVERWRADCGCRIGPPSSQAWRTPLRQAIDWLRDEIAAVYEARAGEVLRDPWGARDRYIECLLEPARTARFLAGEARAALSAAGSVQARQVLELARHALLMQTSCGWFFDDLEGIEPVQNLRYAARALELARALGRNPEDEFTARLAAARGNRAENGSGADVYRRAARAVAATPARVAGSAALLAVLGRDPAVPSYEVRFSRGPADGRLVAEAEVTELATGTSSTVAVEAEWRPDAPPTCRAGDVRFGLEHLFGAQRETLATALVADVAAREDAAHEGVRPLLDPLLAPEEAYVAGLGEFLGRGGARRIEAGLADGSNIAVLVDEADALRARGAMFPPTLAERLAAALAARVEALPASATDVLGLLDLVAVTGLAVDLGAAQVRAFVRLREAGWQGASVAEVCERLQLAPEAT